MFANNFSSHCLLFFDIPIFRFDIPIFRFDISFFALLIWILIAFLLLKLPICISDLYFWFMDFEIQFPQIFHFFFYHCLFLFHYPYFFVFHLGGGKIIFSFILFHSSLIAFHIGPFSFTISIFDSFSLEKKLNFNFLKWIFDIIIFKKFELNKVNYFA